MKDIFSLSNKRAEILYFDTLVITSLNNLFMNSFKREGIASVDASGDSTGYSLTVAEHYLSIREMSG